MERTMRLIVGLALASATLSCQRGQRTDSLNIRSSQLSDVEMLDRADRILLGVIHSVTPIDGEYTVVDDLGRPARRRNVLVDVKEIFTVLDRSESRGTGGSGYLRFYYIEDRGMAEGGGTSGPARGVSLGPALIPLRLEYGRWRSVVDLWRPLLSVDVSEAELRSFQKPETATPVLSKLLLTVYPGKNRWPVVANTAGILSLFYGPVDTIRGLRQLLEEGSGSTCSVCLHLASHFPGQYECLNRMLKEDKCGVEFRRRANSVLSGKNDEQRSLINAIRSRKKMDGWIIRARAATLSEALAVYNMHDDHGVRDAASEMRAELESYR